MPTSRSAQTLVCSRGQHGVFAIRLENDPRRNQANRALQRRYTPEQYSLQRAAWYIATDY